MSNETTAFIFDTHSFKYLKSQKLIGLPIILAICQLWAFI